MSIQQLFANGNLPNIVLIITDQERNLQHYPADFIAKLPGTQQLMHTGLTFNQAFTGACMCTPSRAAFLTSNYPAVTGVTTTASPEPVPPYSTPLPSADVFPNLATVLAKAGYQTIAWRGKWHLGGGGPDNYGFSGWDAPDAGNYLKINSTLGAGSYTNDQRFADDILSFLGDPSNTGSPFCLAASFVNPHDVFVAQQPITNSGYTPADLTAFHIDIPKNANEDLSTKPRAQAYQSWTPPQRQQQDYVNFYAYLQTLVDGHIVAMLEALQPLLDNTLIVRFADHGEQGLSHSLVEKFYNAYEETIHIPLVFSNPVVWPSAQTSDSPVSLVDLVPTLASLLGVSDDYTGKFMGTDLTQVLENPDTVVHPLGVHFTYDDQPAGTAIPSIIRTIRTAEYAYSVYFLEDGSDADWELYDLTADLCEDTNVAGLEAYGQIQQTLDDNLQTLMSDNGTLPAAFKWPPTQTGASRGGPPAVGANAKAAALANEVTGLAAGGAGSVDRLSQILHAPDTPHHIVVKAARALASINTPDAHSVLHDALYGPWPRAVTAQVHQAYAQRSL
jgi:choline-sulfatase